MKRIVCDTNIYISAFLFPKSKPALLLDLARMGVVDLYISPFIMQEFERILHTKFNVPKTQITKLIRLIHQYTRLVEPHTHISVIKEKQDDNRILECATSAKADYLITGDKKHILPLKEYIGIRIYSPAEFLQRKLWY